MRPIDETWEALGPSVFRHTGAKTGQAIASFECRDPDDLLDEARAKLAAQAPTMARLLLQMHRDGVVDGCHDAGAVAAILRDAGVIP